MQITDGSLMGVQFNATNRTRTTSPPTPMAHLTSCPAPAPITFTKYVMESDTLPSVSPNDKTQPRLRRGQPGAPSRIIETHCLIQHQQPPKSQRPPKRFYPVPKPNLPPKIAWNHTIRLPPATYLNALESRRRTYRIPCTPQSRVEFPRWAISSRSLGPCIS